SALSPVIRHSARGTSTAVPMGGSTPASGSASPANGAWSSPNTSSASCWPGASWSAAMMDRSARMWRVMPSCLRRASPATGKCWNRRASTTSSTSKQRMRRSLLLSLFALAACMQQPGPSAAAQAAPQAPTPGGCLADGQGGFEAVVRGAVQADIHWRNAQMTCDGDLRPDGSGLRITMAGTLKDARQLRFIFGIDLTDADSGPAQVLPTNLTVLVEGEALLFATR